jgi:hypothetical protein
MNSWGHLYTIPGIHLSHNLYITMSNAYLDGEMSDRDDLYRVRFHNIP